jgi:hypothetical protein
VRSGIEQGTAQQEAEAAVLGIQGALVLSRALDDHDVFRRAIAGMKARLSAIS